MRPWRFALIATVVVLHLGAPSVLLQGHYLEVTDRWIGYAIPALAVSAVLATVFLFTLPQTIYVIVFLTQWLLVYVVGLPLGDWIGLELVFSVILVIEFALIAHPAVSIPTSVGAIIFMAAQQGPTDAWSVALPPVTPGDIAGYLIITAIAGAAAAAVRVLTARVAAANAISQEKNAVIQRLVNANMEYQRYALEVEKSTVRAERERISREIHDTVGYAFTNQRMMLEASTVLFDRDHQRLKKLIIQAQESLTQGYQQVRSALRALRSVGTPVPSLNNRILQLTRQFSDVSGVEVKYEAVGTGGTGSEELDQAMFRSVQEGITNAFCHGGARNVTVTLSRRDGVVHLRVLDDGIGSEVVQEGIGITGMRERLAPFSGAVNYRSLSPGFVLEIEVPR